MEKPPLSLPTAHRLVWVQISVIAFVLPPISAGLLGSSQPGIGLVVAGIDSVQPQYKHGPVKCLGRISDDNRMRQVYNAVDVVAVPSEFEAFGQVAAEAQACGVPVVASRVGGLIDVVIPTETGLHVSPKNPHELAAGLDFMRHHPHEVIRMGRNAERRARERWNPSLVARQYIDVYGKVLENLRSANL